MAFHGIPPGFHRIPLKCHGNNITSMAFHGIPLGCHRIPLKCHGNSIETIETMAISETGNHDNAKVYKKKKVLECTIWQENTKNSQTPLPVGAFGTSLCNIRLPLFKILATALIYQKIKKSASLKTQAIIET